MRCTSVPPNGVMSTQVSNPASTPLPGIERVEPQLRDLLALAGPAGALPAWTRVIRARASGPFLSRLRGRGIEYDESRPYLPGDDIRQLDWRVTARTGRPHTKMFREERERPVLLCVDYRRAMFFATRGVFKAVQAARAASLLAWHAQQNSDRVGGLLFADSEHHELPPRRGRTATLQWLKLLVAEAPRQRSMTAHATGSARPLTEVLQRLTRVAKPGTLVFVISDFRGFDEQATAALVQLGLHVDVGLIAIHDPLEANFPAFDEAASIADGERSMRLAGIGRAQRDSYAAQFSARIAAVRQICRERRMLFTSMDTTAEPGAALIKLFGG